MQKTKEKMAEFKSFIMKDNAIGNILYFTKEFSHLFEMFWPEY